MLLWMRQGLGSSSGAPGRSNQKLHFAVHRVAAGTALSPLGALHRGRRQHGGESAGLREHKTSPGQAGGGTQEWERYMEARIWR